MKDNRVQYLDRKKRNLNAQVLIEIRQDLSYCQKLLIRKADEHENLRFIREDILPIVKNPKG